MVVPQDAAWILVDHLLCFLTLWRLSQQLPFLWQRLPQPRWKSCGGESVLTWPPGGSSSSFTCLVKSFQFCVLISVGQVRLKIFFRRITYSEPSRRNWQLRPTWNYSHNVELCHLWHLKTSELWWLHPWYPVGSWWAWGHLSTTAVHQVIHFVLAAAVCCACCRWFILFAIKRTRYQVLAWLLFSPLRLRGKKKKREAKGM